MKEGIIHSNITIPPDNKAAIISQPGKSAFDFPSAFVPSQFAAVVIFLSFIVAAVRANQFDTSLSQSATQRVTVVTFISNQPSRFFSRSASAFARHRDIVQCFFEQRDFVRGRRVHVVSQRNTFAVDHHHPLRSLAAFGLSDALAPFFAGAKLPSANASLQSNCPRWSSSERKVLHALSHISCSSQSLSLRQHVEGLGYCFGKSAHGAPVRSTQSIPSNTLRLSAQGLPPCFDFLGFGSRGSIFFHCESVNFHRSLAIEKTPFYSQVYISLERAQV